MAKAGDLLENPVTGQSIRIIKSATETGGLGWELMTQRAKASQRQAADAPFLTDAQCDTFRFKRLIWQEITIP